MEKSTNIKKVSLNLITFLLIILWAMVSLEKIWALDVFHKSLLRQPFPSWWSDILYLVLPFLELATVILIIWPNRQRLLYIGMWLSSILMLCFSIFIGLAVLGVYPKQVCGCSFLISGISFDQHLIFNLFFLIISLLGVWLSKPRLNQEDPDKRYRKPVRLWWSPRAVSKGKLKKLLSLQMIFNREKFTVFRRSIRK